MGVISGPLGGHFGTPWVHLGPLRGQFEALQALFGISESQSFSDFLEVIKKRLDQYQGGEAAARGVVWQTPGRNRT